jgi:hypothetical protein
MRLIGHATLEDLDAERRALIEHVAELHHQMRKFRLVDEDMTAVLGAVNETFKLLGHTRRALASIGEAAQTQQIMESRQDGKKRAS